MLDADGKDVDKYLSSIEKHLVSNKGSIISLNHNLIVGTDINYLFEVFVHSKESNEIIGKFLVLFFAKSLEYEIDNIDNSIRLSEDGRISKLIECEDVTNVFSSILINS